jgi:hypothetical protein
MSTRRLRLRGKYKCNMVLGERRWERTIWMVGAVQEEGAIG